MTKIFDFNQQLSNAKMLSNLKDALGPNTTSDIDREHGMVFIEGQDVFWFLIRIEYKKGNNQVIGMNRVQKSEEAALNDAKGLVDIIIDEKKKETIESLKIGLFKITVPEITIIEEYQLQMEDEDE